MLPQIMCAVCNKPVKHQGEEPKQRGYEISAICHGQQEQVLIPYEAMKDPSFRFEKAFQVRGAIAC